MNGKIYISQAFISLNKENKQLLPLQLCFRFCVLLVKWWKNKNNFTLFFFWKKKCVFITESAVKESGKDLLDDISYKPLKNKGEKWNIFQSIMLCVCVFSYIRHVHAAFPYVSLTLNFNRIEHSEWQKI